MSNLKRYIIFLAVAMLCLIFTGAAYASDGIAPSLDDEVVFFGTFTLESGEKLDGSLIVFGGVIEVEADALVTGDLVVFGGNVTVDGTVEGSLLAVGGVVSLNENAIIKDDLIAPATVVRKEEGAQIFGQIITETELENLPEVPEIEPPEVVVVEPPSFWENLSYALRPVVNFFTSIVRALLFAAIALVVLLILPRQGERVSNAIQENTVLAGGFGLLSVIVFAFAVVLLALLSVTIILIPITIPAIILLALVISLGLFFGVIVVGAEFGRRLMGAFKQTWNKNVQAAIGTFSLVFLLGLFNLALWDFLAAIVWTIVGSIGLGAVLLTRFGTREYVGSGMAVQPASTAEMQDDEIDEDEIETMVRKRPDQFKFDEEDTVEEVSEDASEDASKDVSEANNEE